LILTQKIALLIELSPKLQFTRGYHRSENRWDLDSQAERLCQYSAAKGYQVVHIVKEVGSGLNDHRKKLENLLKLDDYNILIVEHKDRLCRNGRAITLNYFYLDLAFV